MGLIAPLTDELKQVLRDLNKNNIIGYSAIMEHLGRKGYRVGCVSAPLSGAFNTDYTYLIVAQNCLST